jgi:1-deoxy-D-xylulose-5-phosphate reductoisomerase
MTANLATVAILGSTGTIGQAALEVVASLPDRLRLGGVSGYLHLDLLYQQGLAHRPPMVVLAQSDAEIAWQRQVAGDPASTWVPKLLRGEEGLVALATDPSIDIVVAAIVGRAGMESTLAALEAGKRVALANKETLVVAGPLVAAKAASAQHVIPVDSEHSAIFQCLAPSTQHLQRLVLTASGGPFRSWTTAQMEHASVAHALAHPTWRMGKKISIDSATMMNKALEIIEARWLFGVDASQIEVVVHPQSIVHSMVEFVDGSVLAQLSPPDMRLPIQYALTYPDRFNCPARRMDWTQSHELRFEPADRERFPALELGFEVARQGGTAGAVLNAANEQAVELFLAEKIRLTDIVPAVRAALDFHTFDAHPSLTELIRLDRWARAEVVRWSLRCTLA